VFAPQLLLGFTVAAAGLPNEPQLREERLLLGFILIRDERFSVRFSATLVPCLHAVDSVSPVSLPSKPTPSI